MSTVHASASSATASLRSSSPTIRRSTRSTPKYARACGCARAAQAMPGRRRPSCCCAQGSTFFSGADIGEFSGPPQEEEYRALFNAYEDLSIPVVAAMHGTVLGGGLEIALACHYRVAAPGTRFGMPEVTLGIIPAPAARNACRG